ncbi:hypothetical protein CGRA01v4_08235 [Colletotrichum graminicola]|nr:hypothetical protein CGRA01v4_08235 [Colletotrichum graminicola]
MTTRTGVASLASHLANASEPWIPWRQMPTHREARLKFKTRRCQKCLPRSLGCLEQSTMLHGYWTDGLMC